MNSQTQFIKTTGPNLFRCSKIFMTGYIGQNKSYYNIFQDADRPNQEPTLRYVDLLVIGPADPYYSYARTVEKSLKGIQMHRTGHAGNLF